MDDYIKREAFLDDCRKRYCENCDRRKGIKDGKEKFVYEIGDAPCRSCGVDDAMNDVELFPAADVRENVRGEWILSGNEKSAKAKCDQCGFDICVTCEGSDAFVAVKAIISQYIFCPNCGACMRGEKDAVY